MQDTQEQKGFSIVEILISLVIGLIVLAALATTFIAQNKAYNVQEQVTGMLQAARAGIDIMGREIMMAGFDPAEEMQLTDPDASKFVGIPLPALNPASVIEIYADLNGDGDTADANEHIIYAFANGQLTRNTGSGAQPFIENVESFSVTYRNAAGGVATNTGDIRQIEVTLEVGTSRADVDYPRTRTLTSSFIPRNLNNTTTTTSSASSTTIVVTTTTEEETTTTEEATTTTAAQGGDDPSTTTTTLATTTTTTLATTTTTLPPGGFEVTIIVAANNKSADVTANIESSVAIGLVQLFYKVNDGARIEMPMGYDSLDGTTYTYSITITGLSNKNSVDYYVVAYSSDGDYMGMSSIQNFIAQ